MMAFDSGRANREIDPGDCVRGSMIFMPISLGNHYYSNEILTFLISEFVSKSHNTVILLCDRLRFLSYQIRGEFILTQITANIRLQVEQMTRTLVKIGLNSYPNARVTDWSFVKGEPRFDATVSGLHELVEQDPTVRELAQGYVMRLLSRFHGLHGPTLDRAIHLQRRYIIEETALSLYMTEICGFNVEVYRRGLGFVDDLCAQKPAELLSLIGKPAFDRRFISIESYLEQRMISND